MFPDIFTTLLSGSVQIFDLSRIHGGPEAILSRITSEPGVYAWFRNYSDARLDTARDGKTFADNIESLITAKHCTDRTGALRPLFEVVLRSHKTLPTAKKQKLERLASQETFRNELNNILSASLLFSQPLYVGCASVLSRRVEEHLKPESTLRTRLSDAGNVDIEKCWLVLLRLPQDGEITESRENLIEDILSRLFHPLFTRRFG